MRYLAAVGMGRLLRWCEPAVPLAGGTRKLP